MPSALSDQLNDLKKAAEKLRVKLTPEVEKLIREGIERVQAKIEAKEPLIEIDFSFIQEIKWWMEMPEIFRAKYPSIQGMRESEESKTAEKNHLTLRQWLDLLYVAKVKGEKDEKKWIDQFIFPGKGRITIDSNLDLENCAELTRLPEGLDVWWFLNLKGCTKLTALPKRLKVGKSLDLRNCTGLLGLPEDIRIESALILSQNLKEQVKKDAEKLKQEGKIGELSYIADKS